MANTQIDVAVAGNDISDLVATAAGTVTNDVRVVLKTGIDRGAAVVALQNIVDRLATDGFTLQ